MQQSISKINIHKGTYEQIQKNINNIQKHDFIFLTNKSVPFPSTTDTGKLVMVDARGEYILAHKPATPAYVFDTYETFKASLVYTTESPYTLESFTTSSNQKVNVATIPLGTEIYIAEEEIADYWLYTKEITDEADVQEGMGFFKPIETKPKANAIIEVEELPEEPITNAFYKVGATLYYSVNGEWYGVVNEVSGILDVDKLPSDNISEKLIYRLKNGENSYSYWVYKDKWVQLIDSENMPSNGIIDVESLPQSGWSGTAVPVDGSTVIENIYLNNNLSIEETIAEMDKITDWNVLDESSSMYLSFLLADGNGIMLAKMSGTYVITSPAFNPVYFISDGSAFDQTFNGWNPNITYPISLNSESILEFQGFSVGQENDKISSLFSTTSFVYSDEKPKENAIYRLKEGDNYTYWVYKDKWSQLIDSQNIPIIETTCAGFLNDLFEDITLTEEQFNIAKNAEDCLLIVTIGTLVPFYFRKTTGYYIDGDNGYGVVCFVGNQMSISSDDSYIYTNPTPVMLTFTDKELTAKQEKLKLFKSFTYASYGGLYIETGEGSASVRFDTTPTQNSNQLVSSGGVYTALQGKLDKTLSDVSSNTNVATTDNMLINKDGTMYKVTIQELQEVFGSDNYKGNFTSTTSLPATGKAGDYAFVKKEVDGDTDLYMYIWNDVDGHWEETSLSQYVKNATFQATMETKQDKLTFDEAPVENSNNPVTSGGVYEALQNVGGIIDVDSLPQSGWSGTAVPVDGSTVIENIYLNNNLSIEETIAEMDKITDWIDLSGDSMYPIFISAEGNGIMFVKMDGVYIIVSFDYASFYFISDGSVMGFDFSGWNSAITYPIAINAVSLTEMEGVAIGTQNDKIINLISTTPFEYSEAGGDEKVIYRLKGEKPDKTHLEGTLLVSNPDTTVNKVFFNNELSVEETVEILSGLTYTDFQGFICNILYTNETATHLIFALHNSETQYDIFYSPSVTDTSQAITIFTNYDYNDGSTLVGWNKSEVTINDVGVTELYGLSIGAENDKLLSVLSMNDGFTEVVDSYKDSYTYWAYKDKWLQLIDSDNFNEEGLTEYVDLGVFEQQTSSLNKTYAFKEITEEQYDKIFNNDNIVVKLQIDQSEDGETFIMPFQLYPSVSGIFTLWGNSGEVKYYSCISSLESIDQNNVVGSQNHRLIILSGFYNEDTGIYGVGISITDIENFRSDSLYFYTSTINNNLYLRSVYTSSSGIPSSAKPIDTTPTENSTTLVTSGGVYTALQGKQDTLEFDTTPTSGSTNPVTSGGLYDYIEAKLGDINTILDEINGEEV